LTERLNCWIEKLIADLSVNLMMNSISDHITIQYMIVQEFTFGLIFGLRK
jgi:hypothetical protein